ncbi:Bax inhibitor-1/YccA family protein [Phycicoccus endophyticus]|uniref:Bax inhibitor-1/YccA family protein n=1 Tax=Phycicoccus endophyticus TaxID=1690220 RepID=A0A7G9R2H5_9MICO|nr:Bax inhibitor-1/YccA family protein [Phycicoccus endophyticus]NHI20743.1 Bax inhibitor-1/YccA family protein [Phycicoccus endophyticus]QNN49800.1 Bax inhibitor-1/YccA family protein [Phycicoccus endophyticus]GGL35242.1 membrane protein [Phycicoccus endophyticus]
MANNPAFNRLSKDARGGYAGFRTGDGAGASHATADQMSAQQLQDLYNAPSAVRSGTERPVTMDDVVMKTLGLFALVVGFGAVGWAVAAADQSLGLMVWMGGMVATLVLGLVIAFKKTLSVPLIVTYAVVEGLFVGAVSQFFNSVEGWEGVVPSAVLATVSTFAGMFLAYRLGLIKVTAKFRRIMTMAIMGYAVFAVVNVLFAVFTDTPFGFGGTGGLGIAISIFAVGLAAFSLALDFDAIDYAIRTGAPQKYSWLLAHGLIVTIVWLYIEFLRLFARLRE